MHQMENNCFLILWCLYWYTYEAIGKRFVDAIGKRFHVNLLGYSHWFMSIIISQIKSHSISVDKARYATYIVAKYLDTATVKACSKLYKTTFSSDMFFAKADVSTRYKQVEKLTREFNIHYRACIGSLIYLLSKNLDLSFAVHKLETFSSNTGKVHFEGLVHLLRYIIDSNTLVSKYYTDLKYSPLSDLLRQASIKTENHLMAFSDSSWQDFPETGRSAGAYIIFYQGGTIYHGTPVPVIVAQSSSESE